MSKFIDLTGEKFGKLTALELDKERSDNKNKIWKCQCECGNVVFVRREHLRNGNTTSCGCIKIKNLEGKRIGKLTVLERAEDKTQKNGKRLIMWRCKCDCGNETIVPSSRLTSGNTKSCGCGSSRYLRKTHGKSETRLYRVWRGVKSRCYNPNSTGYEYYGGRGVTVCDEWLGENGFENFYKWSYLNGYNENAEKYICTLDRIDVNGNYEPSNCRWVSMKEQDNNKRTNKYIEFNGEKKTLSQWCDEFGVNKKMARYRFNHGWGIEDCLLVPSGKIRGVKKINK